MRVTFDTNTLDDAARPQRFPKDPLQPDYLKVHQAVIDGKIRGFFSETIISLEGIQKNDRSAVFGSTTLNSSEDITVSPDTGDTNVQVTLTVDQPLRKPLHREVAARVRTAHGIGMRLLRAPEPGAL